MRLKQRILQFVMRLSTISIITGVLLAIPDLETDSLLRYKNAAVVFACIVVLGKLLYDTLFFDHYIP